MAIVNGLIACAAMVVIGLLVLGVALLYDWLRP